MLTLGKRLFFVLVILLGFYNNEKIACSSPTVIGERVSAAVTIPLACLQTYFEDKCEGKTTRKKSLITALASLTRIINNYFQHINNNKSLQVAEHDVYLGWMVYDAMQLLVSSSSMISPLDDGIAEFKRDLEAGSDKPSENVIHRNKVIRQALTIAEGGATLLASLYSGEKYTKKIRGTCYSLSSCLRLGVQLLSQEQTKPKLMLGLALVINSMLLLSNLLGDSDSIDRVEDYVREEEARRVIEERAERLRREEQRRERARREEERRWEQQRRREEEQARRMAEEAERRRRAYEQWRRAQEQAHRQAYEEQQRRAQEEAARERCEAQARLTNAYSVLGVSSSASDSEVIKSYRKKALEFHPDRNPSPTANEQMQQLNNARDFIFASRGLN